MNYWDKIEADLFVMAVSFGFLAIFAGVLAWQSVVRNKILQHRDARHRFNDLISLKERRK